MPASQLAKRGQSSISSSPPVPSYILRGHAASVSCVRFSRCARFIFTGCVQRVERVKGRRVLTTILALAATRMASSQSGTCSRSVHVSSGRRMSREC